MILSLKNKVVPLFTPFVQQGLSPIKLMGRKNQGRTPFFKSQNHAFIKNQMEVSL